MKKVIVSGAAGFMGYSLVRALSEQRYYVYAVVRPHSAHNARISDIPNVRCIETGIEDTVAMEQAIAERCDAFIHLAWPGGRYELEEQTRNIEMTMNLVKVAAKLGCSLFLCTGSQAEYGACRDAISEETPLHPFCAYGSAKVAACCLSKYLAHTLGIRWIWGRIFSLCGEYEPEGRLFPGLIREMKKNEWISLSSGRQNWDYLDVRDAAGAIIALMERGKDGEVYNIANGAYRPLRDYVAEMKEILKSDSNIVFGNDPEPFVSLQPSVEKIRCDTGWEARIPFRETVLAAAGEAGT